MPSGKYNRSKKHCENISKALIGIKKKPFSDQHIKKLSEAKKGKIGEKSSAWKGESACYQAQHRWISTHRGSPRYCEHCKRSDKKAYDWANKDHKYKRKFSDYMRLCRKCHRKYDRENNLRK